MRSDMHNAVVCYPVISIYIPYGEAIMAIGGTARCTSKSQGQSDGIPGALCTKGCVEQETSLSGNIVRVN